MPTKRCLDFKDSLLTMDKKASKPLMEKRRRARINHSLAQLKSLIIDPNTAEKSRQAKLEKADILELTVRHLNEIKRRQRTVSLLENRNPRKKFEVGYSECVREVDLFLSTFIDPQTSSVDSELHRRLKQHLNRRLLDLKSIEPIGEQQLKNSDSDDSCITSSSSSKIIDGLQADNNISSESSSSNGESYLPENDFGFHTYPSECDTTATNSSIAEKNFSSPQSDQYSGQSVVSSSSVEFGMVLGDQDFHASVPMSSKNIPVESSSGNLKQSNKHGQLLPTFVRNFSANGKQPSENFDDHHQNMKQIPLVPKHLPNGEWALVLPQDLSITENEVHSFSAFRLVLPSEIQHAEKHFVPSSPSSSNSDASSDGYCFRTNENATQRVNYETNFINQSVWRPW